MVGWNHWLDAHEFEQTQGVGDGQGNLACSSSWGRKESDTTEQLNWTDWTGAENIWVSKTKDLSPLKVFYNIYDLSKNLYIFWGTL